MGTTSPDLLIELDRSRPRGLRAQIEDELRAAIRAGRLAPGTRAALDPGPGHRPRRHPRRRRRRLRPADRRGLPAVPARGEARPSTPPSTAAPGAARARTRGAGVEVDFRPGLPDLAAFPAHGVGAGDPHRAPDAARRRPRLRRPARPARLRAGARRVPRPGAGGQRRPRPHRRVRRVRPRPRPRGVRPARDRPRGGRGRGPRLRRAARRARRAGQPRGAVSRSTARGSWSTGCAAPRRGPSSSPRPTRAPPAWCSRPTGATSSSRWAARRRRLRDRGRLRRRVPLRPPAGRRAAGRRPDRVVYCGTASKSLAPGLRLGWLVAPADLVDPVVAAAPGRPTAPRRRSSRPPTRPSSPTATSTATCAAAAAPTGSGATR